MCTHTHTHAHRALQRRPTKTKRFASLWRKHHHHQQQKYKNVYKPLLTHLMLTPVSENRCSRKRMIRKIGIISLAILSERLLPNQMTAHHTNDFLIWQTSVYDRYCEWKEAFFSAKHCSFRNGIDRVPRAYDVFHRFFLKSHNVFCTN